MNCLKNPPRGSLNLSFRDPTECGGRPARPVRHGALQDFLGRFRDESSRLEPRNGIPAASSYCLDVVAEYGSELLSLLSSVARVCVGYSCYDNGHRFTRRE